MNQDKNEFWSSFLFLIDSNKRRSATGNSKIWPTRQRGKSGQNERPASRLTSLDQPNKPTSPDETKNNRKPLTASTDILMVWYYFDWSKLRRMIMVIHVIGYNNTECNDNYYRPYENSDTFLFFVGIILRN